MALEAGMEKICQSLRGLGCGPCLSKACRYNLRTEDCVWNQGSGDDYLKFESSCSKAICQVGNRVKEEEQGGSDITYITIIIVLAFVILMIVVKMRKRFKGCGSGGLDVVRIEPKKVDVETQTEGLEMEDQEIQVEAPKVDQGIQTEAPKVEVPRFNFFNEPKLHTARSLLTSTVEHPRFSRTAFD